MKRYNPVRSAVKIIACVVILWLIVAYSPTLSSLAPSKACDKKNMCVKSQIKPKDGKCGSMADVADTVTEFNLKNDGKLSAKRVETIDDGKCVLVVYLFYSPARGDYAMKKMAGENEAPTDYFPFLEECMTVDSYFTEKKMHDFVNFVGSQNGVIIVGTSYGKISGTKESFCVLYIRIPAEPEESEPPPPPAGTIEASFKPTYIGQARGFFFC